jgi:hypothetical protein
MLDNASKDLKTLILLRLTKKLIDNTNAAGMIKLENIVTGGKFKKIKVTIPEIKTQDEIKKERKEKIKQEVKEKLEYAASPKINESSFVIVPVQREKETSIPIPKPAQTPKPQQSRRPMPQAGQPRQRIPMSPRPTQQAQARLHQISRQQPDLPTHLQELKPDFTQKPLDIDLGDLNAFLRDPNVKTIETEGADQRVSVSGTMGKKPTGIILDKEKIDEIINKFSKEAKIPVTEGLFKVTIGNTLLTAMISKTLGSRFILKKMA